NQLRGNEITEEPSKPVGFSNTPYASLSSPGADKRRCVASPEQEILALLKSQSENQTKKPEIIN
ncbi:hypothetical protein, partial [Acetobacter sp. DmW_043]|uniref:hypothetical protein n=1 Tax=Acetobacter sp. DmW_043 TaxID=1670658 RepID=UPI001E428D33